MSSEQILFLTTILAFVLAAVAYYHARPRITGLAAAAYFIQNVCLASSLILPEMPVIFVLVVLLSVAFPALCVVLFAIDAWFGAFLLDMAYGLAFAWLLSPLILIVNLLCYFMGGAAA